MSEREDRVNELRIARGEKPLPPMQQNDRISQPTIKEKSPFEKALEDEAIIEAKKIIAEKAKAKALVVEKNKKKKDTITETKEEINTDSLFEADPDSINKEEAKVEEELLNE